MAYADLAVLWGVGILALACLVVCGVYLYWSSEKYRRRKKRFDKQMSGIRATGKNRTSLSLTGADMGTQLSHRCKTSLYRAVFDNTHHESIVFLLAASRDDARERAVGALAAIHGIAAQNVRLSNLASFQEMIDIGISEDRDLRVFELAWKGQSVSAWVGHPLFLTDDCTLLGKWAELYADLARELALSMIDRARG
ncbi:hypothetical protein FVF58_38280 [Paraburkholderia panacisoli]|uniref:Uncharacterized protein n=1 Tax=Paraburkholderia panacisoli TaxID=2603818 RepID=A0A5B0GIR7_9BURK|nr:hypothetical protein [Paraburkholderia panacisoli]KAA1002438.1 hypothetical protein FVF58_38280 [Paraburkholderia panacisoli]